MYVMREMYRAVHYAFQSTGNQVDVIVANTMCSGFMWYMRSVSASVYAIAAPMPIEKTEQYLVIFGIGLYPSPRGALGPENLFQRTPHTTLDAPPGAPFPPRGASSQLSGTVHGVGSGS